MIGLYGNVRAWLAARDNVYCISTCPNDCISNYIDMGSSENCYGCFSSSSCIYVVIDYVSTVCTISMDGCTVGYSGVSYCVTSYLSIIITTDVNAVIHCIGNRISYYVYIIRKVYEDSYDRSVFNSAILQPYV